MASVFRAGSQLASGSVSFVTRHTALTLALSAAGGTAVLALAAGFAIGTHWSARNGSGDQAAVRVEHDYAIDQLGKLNASVAQIEPRIARLTAQVGDLRDFEARLNTPRLRGAHPRTRRTGCGTRRTGCGGRGVRTRRHRRRRRRRGRPCLAAAPL